MEARGAGRYNVIVIGAGTAGLVTAAGTAALGGRVALIERNRMGGDCLNFGCVPSKALISSSRLVHNIRNAQTWGLEKQEPKFAFDRIFERMRARRADLAPMDSQGRFEALGVDVFRGEAKFLSAHEIEIDGTRLHAKNLVIATGTRATVPPIEGLDQVPYFTNETIFDQLGAAPESLAVVGGGPIGCELAQAFVRLGVKVTILNHGRQILGKEDSDVAAFVQARLETEGVMVFNNVAIESCRRAGHETEITYIDTLSGIRNKIVISALLIAAGRTPNIENLALEKAGVEVSEKGVTTNRFLQTSQPHIFAAGDVAGPFRFTHMADYHARIVVRNVLMPFSFLWQKTDYSVVPWCTFTDPEVARAGLNEAEAIRERTEYDVVRQEFSAVDRAVVEDQAFGFAKVLLARNTDKILGATIVSERAGELIHEFVLAMKHGIGLGQIARLIHVYPTFSEAVRKAGDQYNKTRLTPFAHRISSWLYRRQRA